MIAKTKSLSSRSFRQLSETNGDLNFSHIYFLIWVEISLCRKLYAISMLDSEQNYFPSFRSKPGADLVGRGERFPSLSPRVL